jgi:hypothetical protein
MKTNPIGTTTENTTAKDLIALEYLLLNPTD